MRMLARSNVKGRDGYEPDRCATWKSQFMVTWTCAAQSSVMKVDRHRVFVTFTLGILSNAAAFFGLIWLELCGPLRPRS